MKPRLSFSNGYWSWGFEEVQKAGYTCLICATRDAAALAKNRNDRRIEMDIRRLEFEAFTSVRRAMVVEEPSDSVVGEYSDYINSAALKKAIDETATELPPLPGQIVLVDDDDPRLPQRNWFLRLLDRLF
jgi:hypothetical protein